jgi:hypothetical protein
MEAIPWLPDPTGATNDRLTMMQTPQRVRVTTNIREVAKEVEGEAARETIPAAGGLRRPQKSP